MDCKREDGLVYEVQPGKSQDGNKRRVLHRNILIPREAILEEPEEFHLKKKNISQSKQLVTCLPIIQVAQKAVRMSSKYLTPIQSRRVRTREGPAVKDSERSSTPPQHEDIQFTIQVTNNAAAARQDLNKTGSRKKYRQSQDVEKTENQCRKSQDMGRRCSEGIKKYPPRSRNGVRSPSQRDFLAPISNYRKSQPETNISRPVSKPAALKSIQQFLVLNIMEITHMENIKW